MWLLDTIVKLTLLYGIEIWGPSIQKENKWKDLERPLVLIIAHVIRSKVSVSYDIIWAEMGPASIITKALS